MVLYQNSLLNFACYLSLLSLNYLGLPQTLCVTLQTTFIDVGGKNHVDVIF